VASRTDDPRLSVFAVPRLEGVRAACQRLGLAAPREQQVPLDPSAAAAALASFLPADEPITAICAYNDEVALAVLAGLRAHGLTAPTDIAVIGVDNIPAAVLAAPPLTKHCLGHEGSQRDWHSADGVHGEWHRGNLTGAEHGGDEGKRADKEQDGHHGQGYA
jgi:hypothetical protein